jgi:hypothetical protein
MLGEYIGRIFDETRRRPLYLVGKATGLTQVTSLKRASDRQAS